LPNDTPARRRRTPARGEALAKRSPVRSARPSQVESDRRAEEAAHKALSKVLLEGKLRPGTPLRERQLAEIFGLTRGAVRKLLGRLVQEGKVQAFTNRGSFVPQPTMADVEHVYDARKAVESGIVAMLASRMTAAQLSRLRAHVQKERRTQRKGLRNECIKLAGGFHVELVEALENDELAGIMQRLLSRTQMFVALFEPAHQSDCAPDEHERIVEALASRNDGRAVAAMIDHLQRVQTRVTKHIDEEQSPPLVDILRSALKG
jgi:DNA-binding GntR family transcriptional regulator